MHASACWCLIQSSVAARQRIPKEAEVGFLVSGGASRAREGLRSQELRALQGRRGAATKARPEGLHLCRLSELYDGNNRDRKEQGDTGDLDSLTVKGGLDARIGASIEGFEVLERDHVFLRVVVSVCEFLREIVGVSVGRCRHPRLPWRS